MSDPIRPPQWQLVPKTDRRQINRDDLDRGISAVQVAAIQQARADFVDALHTLKRARARLEALIASYRRS